MHSLRDSLVRFAVAATLLLRDLLRRRISLLLLFVVPALFGAVALVTTAHRDLDVTFGSLVEPGAEVRRPDQAPDPFDLELYDNGLRTVDQQALSLVFLGSTAVCFLSCFLAYYLVHKRTEADGRLVLSGYRSVEVLTAKLAVLVVVGLALAGYETVALRVLFRPHDLAQVAAGFALGAVLYGCIGLFVGAIAKHELEGIFLIVLFTNVDAGWLQNPIYYASSERRWLIENLPGFAPTQLSVVGAFTDDSAWPLASRGLVWAAVLLVAALLAFGLRIRSAPSKVSVNAWHRRFYVKIALLSYLAWIVAFQIVGRYASTLPTKNLISSWDLAIPLVPAFVWPYELCYVFPFVPLLALRNWRRYNAALMALVIANVTAFCVYLLLPIAFPRPILGEGLSEQLLAAEYAADFSPGANKLPSMHVAITWIVWCAMRGERGRAFDGAMLAVVGAITLSTLFVKQHILVDVVAGVVWGLAAWWLASWLERNVTDPSSSPRQALLQLFTPWRWRARMRARGAAGTGAPDV